MLGFGSAFLPPALSDPEDLAPPGFVDRGALAGAVFGRKDSDFGTAIDLLLGSTLAAGQKEEHQDRRGDLLGTCPNGAETAWSTELADRQRRAHETPRNSRHRGRLPVLKS